MGKTYLAGPISGLTKDQSDSWRIQFEKMVPGVTCIYPMFAENFAKDRVLGTCHPGELMASAKAVAHKDEFYVRQSDIVLANFVGSAGRPSFGTIIELAWAHMLSKPSIIIAEPNNIHLHPMVTEYAGWVVDNLTDAATVVNGLLGAVSRPSVYAKAA
jgi:nucleoside 2-deoxyribosyltransferase